MTAPKLRIRASGYGGSGYIIPTRNPEGEKRTDPKKPALKVPGVTTVLGALEKPGIVQWSVDHTAAYAVANAHILAERDEDYGFRYLRWYHSRKPDFDNPEVDLHNYHSGVLNDLAEQGTLIHEAIEAFVKEEFGPDFTRQEQVEAFEAFLDWQEDNEVEFLESESSVLNLEHGYAGTLDLVIRHRGRTLLTDVKTSRRVYDSHIAQSAALFNAPIKMVEKSKGVKYTNSKKESTYWEEQEMTKCDGIAVLQVRPRTIDEYGNDVPAFVELHEIPAEEVEPAYEQFLGALKVRHAQNKLKQIRKERENDYF